MRYTMSIVKQANDLFRKKNYHEAKKAYILAANMYGERLFEGNVKLCELRIFRDSLLVKEGGDEDLHQKLKKMSVVACEKTKKAEKNLNSGDVNSALKSYREAVVDNPDNFDAIFGLAKVFRFKKDILLVKEVQKKISEAINYSVKKKKKVANEFLEAISIINSEIMSNAIVNGVHPLLNKEMKSNREEKEPRKILILTCLWQRYEVADFFLKYFSEMRGLVKDEIDLQLLAIGSEGEVTRNLVEGYGFNYEEHENKPLSQKWEYAIRKSKEYDFDAVVILGSDDIIGSDVLRHYIEQLKKGYLFYGFYDAFVYDVRFQGLLYFGGYGDVASKMPERLGESVGLGRMISRELLEALDFSIWKDIAVNSSLDSYMKKRLIDEFMLYPIHEGVSHIAPELGGFKVGQIGGFFEENSLFSLGTKSDVNITDFQRFRSADIANEKKLSEIEEFLKNNMTPSSYKSLKKMAKVDVSIIVMAHKESIYLDRCIQSAVSQDFSGTFEIILASDSCVDLKKYSDKYNIKFSLSKKIINNTSCAKNLNDAVSIATGDYIKIMAYDDFMPQDSIQLLYNEAISNKASLVYANSYEYWSDDKIIEYKPPQIDISIKQQKEKNIIHGGTVFFNREDFLLVGGFDDSLIYAEEYDFYFKLLAHGMNFRYLDNFVYYYRRHNEQKGTLSLSKAEKENKQKIVNEIGKKYLGLKNIDNEKKPIDVKKPVVFGIATIKERIDSLRETLSSIYNQADIIYVYQNNYKNDNVIDDPKNKIVYVSARETGSDFGDAGKFYSLSKSGSCYYFSADDDLVYPEDYVRKTVAELNNNVGSIVTYHGKIFKPNAKNYFKDICINFRCLDYENKTLPLHFGGTGVMAFDTSFVKLPFNIFEEKNMADVWVGYYAKRIGVKIIHLPHTKGWIKESKNMATSDKKVTIYETRKLDKQNVKTENVVLEKFFNCVYGEARDNIS